MKKCLIWILVLVLVLAGCGAPAADPVQAAPETDGLLPHEAAPELGEPEIAEEPEEPALDPTLIRLESVREPGQTSVFVTVTAIYTPTEEVLWTYTTPNCVAAQLETAEYLDSSLGIVYVNQQNYMDGETITEEGGLVALDLYTGEVLWLNSDYTGASSRWCFGPDGTIYISGFFGPDCCAIDAAGNTLWMVDQVNPDWYWPSSISLDGDVLEIRFTGGPEGDGEYYGYIGTDGVVR